MTHSFRRSASLFALAALSCAGAARADEMDDGGAPTIVVTGERTHEPDVSGLKTGTPLRDTPQSVTTLDRERLDDQGIEQLGDALRYVPGVTISLGEGNRDQVVLRGQPTTADFYLDGLRDDAQYYRPLFNIERVEVLKGANALLFGRGGGGGVINRVSKSPELNRTGGTLSGGIDTFGAWSAAGDVNLALSGNAALRLNATYENLDNQRDFFGGHFVGAAPTLLIAPDQSTRVNFAYEYDHDERLADRGIPASPGGSIAAPARPIAGYDHTLFGSPALNRSEVDAHFGRVRIERELADGLKFDVTGQFTHYDKFYQNVVPGVVTGGTVSLSGYNNAQQRDNWIGQANLVWKGSTGPVGHTLLAGTEIGQQTTDSERFNALLNGKTAETVSLAPVLALPSITFNGTRTASHTRVTSKSAYLQDQVELAQWLQVIGGVRYDRFDIDATDLVANLRTARSDGKWSPRIGLVLKPQPSVSFYASYAKSFLPQSGDQFTTLATNLQSLEPEAFRNLEVGVKWDVARDLSLAAAAFQLDRSNTRVADPANPGFFVLTGSSRAKGIEASLTGRITSVWQASLGYTYQEGEIRSTTSAAPAGRQLALLPHHQFAAWTRYDVSPRLGLGLGVVHQSSQFATISNTVALPAFTRIDAAAFVTVSDRLSLQLNVENLTDTRYFASASSDNNILPGKPLTARVTARVTF
ncbi:MAG: TonB-dependent receptor [Novosphingobium sp.]